MARKFKLSSGQAKILRRMDRGDMLGVTRGLEHHFFWHKRKPGEATRVQFTTVRTLLSQGLIVDKEKPELQWRGGHYAITPKGQELLCQIDATKG